MQGRHQTARLNALIVKSACAMLRHQTSAKFIQNFGVLEMIARNILVYKAMSELLKQNMKLSDAIAILQKHNAWRRGETDDMPNPYVIGDAVKLGIAIDKVLDAAKICLNLMSLDDLHD